MVSLTSPRRHLDTRIPQSIYLWTPLKSWQLTSK
jgi:hypothetical protein